MVGAVDVDVDAVDVDVDVGAGVDNGCHGCTRNVL